MGKQQREYEDYDYEDELESDSIDELDFDDNSYYEEQPSKNSSYRTKKKRDARRKIEEYWEKRQLENSLDEYYYHTDD